MLILTRKKSEVIQIGNNIVIKVIQTGKRTVKIGIEAPTEVSVMRGELKDKLLGGPLAVHIKQLPPVSSN